MSKGDSPRPFSVTQNEFDIKWDNIFKKKSNPVCHCHQCIKDNDLKDESGLPLNASRMIVCVTCGNKRCPHASDHRLECTNSNEPGQKGSIYK